MAKDRLFQLIRDEDVVLFVGAGFSLYAGYPSGRKLAEDIYNKLSKSEQQEIDRNKDLPELCDDIYQLQGQNRNFLLRNVKEAFSIEPKSRETHLGLSKIPLFKTIITTNYDTLIEDTHKDIEVIRNGKDLSLADNRKTHLFKIHGDLVNLDKIILTQSDYTNYFTKDKDQTIFWNAVKNELTRHHILFIGYSLEDINVKTIIDKIYGELGEVKKGAYFVAPNLSEVRRRFLRGKGIVYINSTGEEFIKELSQDLKKNYIPYVKTYGGNLDTISTFGVYNNVQFKLTKKDGKPHVVGYKAEDPITPLVQEGRFTINSDAKSKYDNFINNVNNELILTSRDLVDFSFFIGDINLFNNGQIKEIRISRFPFFDDSIILAFDDGYETSEFKIKIELFKPKKNIGLLKMFFFNHEMKLSIALKSKQKYKLNQLKINLRHSIRNVKEGLNFYEILSRVTKGINFRVYSKEEEIYSKSAYSLLDAAKDQNVSSLVYYFRNLKRIEAYFKVRFRDIDLIRMNIGLIENIIAYMDGTLVNLKSKKYKIEVRDVLTIKKLQESNEKINFYYTEKEKTVIEIHNQSFKIGYPVLIFEDVLIESNEKAKGNTENSIFIVGKPGKTFQGFSDAPDVFLNKLYKIETN